MPDEVSTLVSQLRWSLGRDMNTEDMRLRAADLLEQMALGHKVQEKHREALKQLADRETKPDR